MPWAPPGRAASITYTVVATNTGPSTVHGAEISDSVSEIPGVTSDTWTAQGTAAAVVSVRPGSGDINDSVVIPAGASITYTVVATIGSSGRSALSSTVTLAPPAGFVDTNPLAVSGAVEATDSDTITHV